MPPIQTGKPVGVPLGDFFHRWKEISTDSWILQVVGEGLRLSFSEHPPLVNSPVWTKIPTDVGKARALREEVVALLQKRAIERIFKNSVSGVLFKNFRCTQARWQMETSHRLERSKCVHSGTKVSNGNDKGTQVVNIARRFRREHRLCRRVPACTDTPKLKKVPPLCDRPRRICLHGSSVRPKYQSLGFHKDYGCSSRVLKTIRKSCDIELSRRHSAETPVTRGFSKGDRNPILFYKISRFQGEPREIRAGTITDLCTSRHHVSNTSESSLSDTERIEWTGMFAYAFPPAILVPKVIQKIAGTKCMVLLIAPMRWYNSWTNALLDLCVEVPRKLPVRADFLKQPRRELFHQDPASLNLHAWKLSGPLSKENSLARQPWRESLQQEGPPL